MESKKEARNDNFTDLALPEVKSRQSFFVYAKIVFLPTAIYLVALLGYFGYINFQIGLHTVVMMGVIWAI